jgi:LysM repeat protein
VKNRLVTALVLTLLVMAVPLTALAATYTVRPGDTLGAIANANNTTVAELVRLNNILNPNQIYVGQALKLPEQSAPPKAVTYTVKAGDTLGGIAAAHKTTVTELVKLNNLTNPNLVRVGQILTVSGSAIAPVRYTVAAGDSLWLIAKKYGSTVDKLAAANNLSSPYTLFIGQVLVISGGSQAPAPKPGGAVAAHWDYVNPRFARGSRATVIDVQTGLSYQVVRYGGFLHADVEPATAADTAIMRQIYGGTWSWARRSVVVIVNGQRLAASINGMPHGGGGIYNNNFAGHSCIHFLGSMTHGSRVIDPAHQAAVQAAVGK